MNEFRVGDLVRCLVQLKAVGVEYDDIGVLVMQYRDLCYIWWKVYMFSTQEIICLYDNEFKVIRVNN